MSWPVFPLEEITTLVTCGVAKRPEYVETGIPFLSAKNVKNGEVIFNNYNCISKITHETLTKHNKPVNGDILYTRVGSVGEAAIIDSDVEFSIFVSLTLIKPNHELVYNKYLKHLLNSKEFKARAISNLTGIGVGNLNVSVVRKYPIPLPPLEEQKRIAAILDKADAIRRKRQQAIQLADDFLRAVFLDMFGPLSDKNGWRKVQFSDVALIDAKMVDPREDSYQDLLHIGPDRIEKSTGRLLPALTAREESLISKKFLFDDSYVLYSKIRPYLKKCAIPNFTGLCSADMYPVRPIENEMTREFLWQLLLSDEFTQYTESLPARANIPKLNRTELASFEFYLPPIAKQEKFSEIVKRRFDLSKRNQSSFMEKDILFNSLSQKAFAGEL